MKKRNIVVSLFIAAFLVCGFTFVVTAADVDKGPDEMEIKSTLWEKHTKAPVKFTHKQHYEDLKIACSECHHVFEGGKNVWKEGDKVLGLPKTKVER